MRVSICLASYNGAAFIERQLATILDDIGPDDEIILSDDASSDRTLEIVASFGDPRIKAHAFRDNVRHVRNFERALQRASGDLIFLSDQDDVWIPGKRQQIVEMFARHDDAVMVVHALSLVDQVENLLSPRSPAWPSSVAGLQPTIRYLLRQLIKNQVTGCAVAFRRDLLTLLLPFPDAVYAHDHWLSVAAPFAGKVYFLDEVLLKYRQHDANVTPKNGLSLGRQIAVRAKLGRLVAIAAGRAARRRLHLVA
jgi:glycosyltransferase involved in cell wall biosynthesis